MKTNNILKWETKGFIIPILLLQIAIISLICLDFLGINIPILRQIIGFLYLMFIPGILILRILRIYHLNNTEIVVYSSGLSITSIMLLGLLINWLYPIFGILKPLSLVYLALTISVFVILLCFLSYISDKFSGEIFHKPKINIKGLFSNASAFLYLIFIINIFGIILVNFYVINFATLISLLLISIIPLLVAFDKIPKKLYPLSIFIIAISLLFHVSLISMFLYGHDSFNEYFISNIAFQNSYWNLAIQDNVNSILSITVLPAIFANICNMGLEWVFKLIYPFIFSLVPVTLYLIFKEQTSDKISFMACFFFMSIITFSYELPQLFRQEVAELFFSLLLLLFFTHHISRFKKSILLIIFSISLIMSHYGLSYIFAFFILSVWIIFILLENNFIKRILEKIRIKINENGEFKKSINSSLVAFVIVVAIMWYLSVSDSSVFESIVHVGDRIVSNIFIDLFNTKTSEAASIASSSNPLITLKIITYLNLISQFLIGLGFLSVLYKRKEWKFYPEYLILSLLNFIFWIFAVAIPFFSSVLTANRLYHITLLVLSPYFVIGGFKLLRIFKKVKIENYFKILSIFLMIFFIFNIGIVGSFTGDKTNMALDSSADWPKADEKEIYGAKWLMEFKENKYMAYADIYRWVILGAYNWDKAYSFPSNGNLTFNGRAYIYLGTLNVETGQALFKGGRFSGGEYKPISNYTEDINKIYDDGGSSSYL